MKGSLEITQMLWRWLVQISITSQHARYLTETDMGLTCDFGDVDLLRHESGKTLVDKKAEREQFQNDIKA